MNTNTPLEMTDTNAAAELLVRFRKYRGVSQESIAKKLGVDLITISRLESGVIKMTLEQIQAYARSVGYCVSLTFRLE